MRKLFALVLIALTLVVFAAPVGADDGFVLIGADAARVELVNDGCHLEVSYVSAVAVKYFDGSLVMPHEDVDVRLWGDCEPAFWTRNISGGDEDAEIVRLSSAFLDEFEVFDGVSDFYAVADLEWTAVGDAYTQVFKEPGMRAAHRTRDAEVEGTVFVEGLGTFTAQDHFWSAHITHFTTIVKDKLP